MEEGRLDDAPVWTDLRTFDGRPWRGVADEFVHHRNGNTYDNRLENLEVVSPQVHAVRHNQKLPIVKVCVICGAAYIPHKTKRKRQQTCGKPCRLRLIHIRRWGN